MTSWVEAAGARYHKECFDPASLAGSSAPMAGQPTCATCGKGLMGRYGETHGVCESPEESALSHVF